MLFLFFFVLFSVFLSFVGAKIRIFPHLNKGCDTNVGFDVYNYIKR